MTSLLLLGLISFAVTLITTPLCRRVFTRLGVLDRPDQQRKTHARAVPRVGGIPIVVSYFGAFVLAWALGARPAGSFIASLPFRWELVIGTLTVFAAGLLDDVRGLKPREKLLAQTAAALLVWAGGLRILGIHGYQLGTHLSLPITVLWLVGCANAFNLIDGLDGLAAGVGLFATSTILLSAVLQRNPALEFATVPLAATLAAFLLFNFSPASIFLGDGGSLVVGFLLGCYAISWSEKSTTVLGMMAPAMAMAFPLMDTGLAIVRRFLRGQPIFSADRRHIHHRLLDLGWNPRSAVLLLYAFCALAAGLSLLQYTQQKLSAVMTLLLCAAVWAVIQRLGYSEFRALPLVFRSGGLRGTLAADIQLSEFRLALKAATSPEECWEAIRAYYRAFGFSHVQLRLAGRTFSETAPASPEAVDCWTLNIPLSDLEYAQLARKEDVSLRPLAAGSFADTLGADLKAKMTALRLRPVRPVLPLTGERPLTRGAGGGN